MLGAIGAAVERAYGDAGRAGALLRAAYDDAVETKDLPIIAAVGVVVAEATVAAGSPSDGAEMLAAAASLRGAEDETDPEIARLTATLHEALGDDGYAAAWQRGHALERAAAIVRLAP